MADSMTPFVICHHYQQKWRHLVEQAQDYLINVYLSSSALTERKPRWGFQNLPVYFVGFFSCEMGPVPVYISLSRSRRNANAPSEQRCVTMLKNRCKRG